MPSQDFVQRVLEQVVAARADADPVLSAKGYSIRRYRDKLYYLKSLQKIVANDLIWPSGEALLKIAEDVSLEVVESSSGIPSRQWLAAKVTVNSVLVAKPSSYQAAAVIIL